MVLPREEFVGHFVMQYWDMLKSELLYKNQRLTFNRTQKPEFRYWFNTDFIDKRGIWSNFVLYKVNEMQEYEKMELLTAYTVNDALHLLRSSNTDIKDYSLDEMIRQIIDSWYQYDYVIHEFLCNK
jgi:hypothetical protein